MLHFATMGVIRIKDDLQKHVVKFIKLKENKYKYNSIADFVNEAVYEKLSQLKTISKFRRIIRL